MGLLILVLRTDKPESEIGLYDDQNQISYLRWQAHFELAETIHQQIHDLLNSVDKNWHDLEGVVVYKGPGSFTGLRIGISFANTLAYSLSIPIIGEISDQWIDLGLKKLLDGKNDKEIMPEYGAEVHITSPKK